MIDSFLSVVDWSSFFFRFVLTAVVICLGHRFWSMRDPRRKRRRRRSIQRSLSMEDSRRQQPQEQYVNSKKKRSTSLPRNLNSGNNNNNNDSNHHNTGIRPRLLRTRSVDSITATSNRTLPIPRPEDPFALEGVRSQRSRLLVMDLLYNAQVNAALTAVGNHMGNLNNNNNNNNAPRWRRPILPPRGGFFAGNRPVPAPRFHVQRANRDHHFAQEFMRLNYLVVREQQALLANNNNNSTNIPTATNNEDSTDAELQRRLKPIAGNDPACTSWTYDASDESSMQKINAALAINSVLQSIHLHPSAWKDLKAIKELSNIIRNHPKLQQVHLYPGSATRNFVTQLAVDSLLQAFHDNPSITHWVLHLGGTKSIGNVLADCVQSARHLETLEIHDFADAHTCTGRKDSSSVKKLATAIAKAQSKLKALKLVRVEYPALELIFSLCANEGTSCIQTLHIESAKEAGTIGLEEFIRMPNCQLESLTIKGIQQFQRVHADRLVGGLTFNSSVKNVSFVDCSFHPEVVRPLQDLVKNRLDLEAFQITRCNADPSMALLTVCANVYNGKMTCLKSVTMGFSLGIEDRLGGDAIRSVLRYNPNLQSLNLVGSHRLGEVGLRHVARGLGKNSTLRHLDLSHCSITLPSLRLITQQITGNSNSHLTSINLSHNALGIAGVNVLVQDWLLHPNCLLRELKLNRCEVHAEAFLALVRALEQNSSLEVLEVLECGRLGLNELQQVAESFFRLGNLRVMKASCFKSPVQPIRPVPAHVLGGPPDIVADDMMFLDDDEDDDADDSDEEEIFGMARLRENEVANRPAAHGAASHPNNSNSSTKLLKETFLAGLIHNHRLEHISLTNILECVLKPKDATRVRAWMDFCGKRNLMQPLLQQTEIPLLDILLDVIRECRDPRTCSLNATGVSLQYYCLRNRPDALDRVQRMLVAEEARRLQPAKVNNI